MTGSQVTDVHRLSAVRVATTDQYPCEWQRIALVCARDGLAEAVDFCARTARIYRSAVLASARRGHERPHFASLPKYRIRFVGSYLDFKRFVRNQSESLESPP